MNPYLHLLEERPAKEDKRRALEWDKLYRLSLGLLYMQCECGECLGQRRTTHPYLAAHEAQAVLTLPYANSFGPPNSAGINYKKNQLMNSSNHNADWLYPPAPGQKSHWDPHPSASYAHDIDNDGVSIWEAKWEVDSLANFFRLAVRLAKTSNRTDFVHNPTWKAAAQMALSALRAQQRETEAERRALAEVLKKYKPYHNRKQKHKDSGLGKQEQPKKWKSYNDNFAVEQRKPALPNVKRQSDGTVKKELSGDQEPKKLHVIETQDRPAEKQKPTSAVSEWDRRFGPLAGGLYRFQRGALRSASETKSEKGFGEPAKYTGMIKSAFRPSDDATILPFFVPGNA